MDKLQEIKDRWERAPDGPWILATSCSWRRIIRPNGESVCVPIKQRSDGHPDLLLPNHAGEAIANSPEDVKYLIRRVEELQDQNEDLKEAAQEGFEYLHRLSEGWYEGGIEEAELDNIRSTLTQMAQAIDKEGSIE